MIAACQVGRLRIEEVLPLARRGQLFERREIDGAERFDFLRQTRDLRLQRRRLLRRSAGEFRRQCRFVGAGFGKLICKLLGSEPRRLFLQLQLGEFLAQRLHVALECQSLLVGGTQLLREVVQMAARLAQRLVGRRAAREPVGQSCTRRAVVEPLQLVFGLADFIR